MWEVIGAIGLGIVAVLLLAVVGGFIAYYVCHAAVIGWVLADRLTHAFVD